MEHRDCRGRCRRHHQRTRIGITVLCRTVNGSNGFGLVSSVSSVNDHHRRNEQESKQVGMSWNGNGSRTLRRPSAVAPHPDNESVDVSEVMRNGEWEPCRGFPTSKTVRVVVIRVSANDVQLIIGAPAAGKHSHALDQTQVGGRLDGW